MNKQSCQGNETSIFTKSDLPESQNKNRSEAYFWFILLNINKTLI